MEAGIVEKNIGIDIDGVLTAEGDDHNNIWQKALSEYVGYELKRKKDVFNFIEAYDLSPETIENFINKNIKSIYRNSKPAGGSQKAIQELSDHGYNIILITARNQKYRELTINWLQKYSIKYNELYFEKDKAPLAKRKNIKVFVEDNQDNAHQLMKNNIIVIVKDRYHNRQLKKSNKLYRAKNWKKIKKYIFEIYNEI